MDQYIIPLVNITECATGIFPVPLIKNLVDLSRILLAIFGKENKS